MAFLLLTVLINWSSSIGKTKFWLQKLRRLLCNTLIQLHFDYACSAWYFNLTKKLKSGTQTAQNKFISFYLQLDNMILMWYFTRFDTMYTIWKTWKTHMEECYFQSATTLKWLPLTNRFKALIQRCFIYFDDHFPNYLDEIFKTGWQKSFQTRASSQKLKWHSRKTNVGQNA